MPLTHDMGLIGFHIIMFASRLHAHLMPTELFIRRPLLWVTLASRVRATILCSPNFGYKHYLKVLGERTLEGLDLSAVRLIFNGAEPISVELCDEFLARLAPAHLAAQRHADRVRARRGVARGELPAARRAAEDHHPQPPPHGLGSALEAIAAATATRSSSYPRAARSAGCRLRVTDDEDREVAEDRIGHVQITGDNVTRGYFEDPRGQRRRLHRRRLAAHRRPRPDPRGRSLHLRARQGDHLRQRSELLPARPRGDRAARPGSGARQGRRRGRAPGRGGRPRSSWCSCCTGATWRNSCRLPPR